MYAEHLERMKRENDQITGKTALNTMIMCLGIAIDDSDDCVFYSDVCKYLVVYS